VDIRRLSKIVCSWGLAAGVLLAATVTAAPEDERSDPRQDQCLSCHTEFDILPDGLIRDDVHLETGLSCAGCHGGDPAASDQETAMSPAAGFVGVPAKDEIPEFCGKCHSHIDFMRRYQPRIPTDQVQQYATSVHGQRLAQGDTKVADCVSCHTAHGVLPPSDARSAVHPLNVPMTCKRCHSDADYMREYHIPTDQFAEYAKSVHGVALLENQDTGSPACNDCHGNHGAAPPGFASVRQVCGHCHVNNMEYFRASAMGRAFEREKLHDCEECHGNHDVEKTTIDMVGVGERSVCVACHAEGDTGYAAASEIYDHLQGLVAVYERAETRRAEVARKGMDDVEIGFLLQESHQDLIQARTLVHTFDPDRVAEKTDDGVEKAREALDQAIAEVEEYRFRRRGFGLATIFITLLVIVLYVKIRQMEAK
jgi:hypothetical protein